MYYTNTILYNAILYLTPNYPILYSLYFLVTQTLVPELAAG